MEADESKLMGSPKGLKRIKTDESHPNEQLPDNSAKTGKEEPTQEVTGNSADS
jgi:hypothetical protein